MTQLRMATLRMTAVKATAFKTSTRSTTRLRARLAGESGYAIVVVMGLMMVALTIGAAALTLTLSSSKLTVHDMRVRRAQQAADAGIQAQLYDASEADLGSTAYNFNGGVIGLSNFLDCTVPKLNASLQITGIASAYANSAGVCPSAVNSSGANVTSQTFPAGNHTTFQSEMITGQTNFLNGTTTHGSQNGSAMRVLNPKIVSIGTENSNQDGQGTVYSREEAVLAPIAPLQAIEGENNVTIDGGLNALGLSVATLNGNVLAMGNLTTPTALAGLNLSNGLFATLAYGGSYTGGLSVGYLQHVSSSSIPTRSAVKISSSKANCANSSGTSVTCSNTLFSCSSCYSSTTDSFTLSSGSATITSGDYVFCNFNVTTSGTLTISPTSSSAPVRIFIDSPTSTRCASNGLGSNQGNFNDTAGFSNTLQNLGSDVAPSTFQVYLAGNGTAGGTSVQVGPTSTSSLLSASALTYPAVIYAPMSNVTVNVPALCVLSCSLVSSGGIFEGNAIGYNTTINALTITQDLDLGNYPLYAGVNAFRVTEYVQCDNTLHALTGSTTDTNGC